MKKILLVAGAVGLLSLGACASGGFLSSPQNDLNAADAGVAALEALYSSSCAAGALPASICTLQDQAEAAQLEQAITQAIGTAQGLISVYSGAQAGTMPTTAQIAQAITGVTQAVENFSNFVNGLSVKKSAALKARLRPGG
jgi:hypothetical protein